MDWLGSRSLIRIVVTFAVSLIALTGTVQADVQIVPSEGVTDEYRIRLSTYNAENQMPLLIIAAEYRDTALPDGRRQIDVYLVERYQPFGRLWLPSIIDSVEESQDDLPEGVQLRLIIDSDSAIDDLVPNDIPDIALGLIVEIVQIVRAQMTAGASDDLQDVTDEAPIRPFTLRWHRNRTNATHQREYVGGRVALDAGEADDVVLRWTPDQIRWTSLQIGSPNQLVTSRETLDLRLRINPDNGALLGGASERDLVQTVIIGPVDFAEMPAWDEIDHPDNPNVYATHRFIEVLRLEEHNDRERQQEQIDEGAVGPLAPGAGD